MTLLDRDALMNLDPLRYASSELREAVDAMGGEALLAAIDAFVQDNEEYTVDWFDARWDDLIAEEIVDWSIARLAKTGPTIAHAELEVALRTYPINDDDDEFVGDVATLVKAYIRFVFEPQPRPDRYDLEAHDLAEWIMRDAIRFVDRPESD